MKTIKVLAIALFAGALSTQAIAADNNKTAESVFASIAEMETVDQDVLQAEISELSFIQKVKLIEMSYEDVQMAQAAGVQEPSVGMYVLAVLIPPVAVGLHTNWGMPTVWNLVWCLFGYLPGIVHAFIVLGR